MFGADVRIVVELKRPAQRSRSPRQMRSGRFDSYAARQTFLSVLARRQQLKNGELHRSRRTAEILISLTCPTATQ